MKTFKIKKLVLFTDRYRHNWFNLYYEKGFNLIMCVNLLTFEFGFEYCLNKREYTQTNWSYEIERKSK